MFHFSVCMCQWGPTRLPPKTHGESFQWKLHQIPYPFHFEHVVPNTEEWTRPCCDSDGEYHGYQCPRGCTSVREQKFSSLVFLSLFRKIFLFLPSSSGCSQNQSSLPFDPELPTRAGEINAAHSFALFAFFLLVVGLHERIYPSAKIRSFLKTT